MRNHAKKKIVIICTLIFAFQWKAYDVEAKSCDNVGLIACTFAKDISVMASSYSHSPQSLNESNITSL